MEGNGIFKSRNQVFLPEDTHTLLCVPIVEELQAGDEEKLGKKEKLG